MSKSDDMAADARLLLHAASRANILLVANDPDNRSAILQALAGEHYAVRPVTSTEVPAHLEEREVPPDLILLAGTVPGMTIDHVCRQVRQRYAAQHVPLLLLLPAGQLSAVVGSLQAGASDYVFWPGAAEELLARIQVHLHLARLQHDQAGAPVAVQTAPSATDDQPGQYRNDAPTARASRRVRQPDPTDQPAGMSPAPGTIMRSLLDHGHGRQEENLYAGDEPFRVLFDRAPVGIGVARDNVIITVNPACLQMFGYAEASEVVGTLMLQHVAPNDRVTLVERIMRRAQGEEVSGQFALMGLRKDGSRFPMLYNAVPLLLSDGQEAMVFFMADMSDLKRAEEERDQFFTLSRDMLCIAGTDGYFKRLNPAWQATLGLTTEELLAEPYLAFVHPDDREATRASARPDMMVWPRQVSFENRYRCKDGSYKWLAWSYTLIPDLQLFYGAARDVTEQKRVAQKQERLYRVAEGLRDVLAVINSDRSLADILHFIVCQATRLQGADVAVIYRFLQPGSYGNCGILRVEAAQGFEDDYVGVLIQEAQLTICYEAIQRREPVAIADATAQLEQLLANATLGADYRRLVTEIRRRFRSTLVVPLIIQDEVYGTITLYDARERNFIEDDMKLSVAFAAQSALAIETARLRQRVRQAAVREERGRLARELHDSVTQSLYSVTLLAEGWRLQAREEQLDHIEQHFARLGHIAHQALKEMRLLIYQLRLPVLEKEGLVGAVQRRLEAVERRSGIVGRVLVEGEGILPTLVEEQLYRIIQEALNNALKHADAQVVTVSVRYSPPDDEAAVEVEIVDDGHGFDPAGVLPGVGMDSMRERAEQLGGSMTVQTQPGAGTRVVVRVKSRIERISLEW